MADFWYHSFSLSLSFLEWLGPTHGPFSAGDLSLQYLDAEMRFPGLIDLAGAGLMIHLRLYKWNGVADTMVMRALDQVLSVSMPASCTEPWIMSQQPNVCYLDVVMTVIEPLQTDTVLLQFATQGMTMWSVGSVYAYAIAVNHPQYLPSGLIYDVESYEDSKDPENWDGNDYSTALKYAPGEYVHGPFAQSHGAIFRTVDLQGPVVLVTVSVEVMAMGIWQPDQQFFITVNDQHAFVQGRTPLGCGSHWSAKAADELEGFSYTPFCEHTIEFTVALPTARRDVLIKFTNTIPQDVSDQGIAFLEMSLEGVFGTEQVDWVANVSASYTASRSIFGIFRRNWAILPDEASDFCQERGALLATVHDESELSIIAASLTPGAAAWVGLQRDLSGNFKWADGRDLTMSLTPVAAQACATLSSGGSLQSQECKSYIVYDWVCQFPDFDQDGQFDEVC